MSDKETTSSEILSAIRKYGMDHSEWEEAKADENEIMNSMLVEYIEHLREHNDILRASLDQIASGLITAGEATDLAQYTLERTTLRKWRNKNE
jgi:hypothetical protein